MKLTHQLLEQKISEYLDDIYSYGDVEDLNTVKNILSTMNHLLVESHGEISKNVLLEMANNSTGESKLVLHDFLLYLEE